MSQLELAEPASPTNVGTDAMTEPDIIDAEVESVATETTELILAEQVPMGSLSVQDPAHVLASAKSVAVALVDVIEQRGLAVRIKDKDFVVCEGWTTLAGMLGVTPRLVEVTEAGEGEFVAVVEAVRGRDGAVIGRAEASCGPDERDWKSRSRQARRSMAQTRATGKVFRLLFSWVMVLAGYEPLPAEEASDIEPERHDNPDHDRSKPKTTPRAERATKEDVAHVVGEWKTYHSYPSEEMEGAFRAWVFETVGVPIAKALNAPDWSKDQIASAMNAIHRERDGAEPPKSDGQLFDNHDEIPF